MITFGLTITILAAFIALKISRDTQGACFFGASMATNNELLVRSADQIRLLDWPCKMHLNPMYRNHLREYWTLFIHILGRFKKDKLSDHMNVTLALLANAVSCVLIFLVFSNYFTPFIGFIVALLYTTSFWPYQVALYTGHLHLAQMFFLLAVLCLQTTELLHTAIAYLMFFFGGLFTAVSFFSSSSSRKYPPIAVIALVYALREHIVLPRSVDFAWGNYLWILGIIFFASAVNLAININLKNVISLLKKMTVNDKWKEKHIITLRGVIKKILIIIILFGLLFNFNDSQLTLSLGSFVLGLAIINLHIFFPPKEFLSNVSRFFNFMNISEWGSHFNAYPDPIRTFGREIPVNFRGGGLNWINLLFFRMMPFVYPLYLAGLLFLIFQATLVSVKSGSLIPIASVFSLIMLSLLTVIIHEITRGLKVGKSFMSALLIMLLVPAAALDLLIRIVSDTEVMKSFLWAAVGLIIVMQLLHTVYVLYSDTIPCRMAPTILRNKLKDLGVNMFFTYNIPYNNSLVVAMMSKYSNEFKVNFINSISEVKKGIVVIPNTSSKSVNMETEQYAIVNGDFDKDKELNKLYENRRIEDTALSKIRTMGSSKYYVHESEVTSYREFILKQISEQDRWRGNAWIINL